MIAHEECDIEYQDTLCANKKGDRGARAARDAAQECLQDVEGKQHEEVQLSEPKVLRIVFVECRGDRG